MIQIPLSRPPVDDDVKQAVLRVIDSGEYILGAQCREFEGGLARYVGTRHCILTSSATAGLVWAPDIAKYTCFACGSNARATTVHRDVSFRPFGNRVTGCRGLRRPRPAMVGTSTHSRGAIQHPDAPDIYRPA